VCFLAFNVDGRRTAAHGANVQPQPLRPTVDEGSSEEEEEEAKGADNGSDIYGDEPEDHQAEEGPQEGGMLAPTDAYFQQDANMDGHEFFGHNSNFDPSKSYYEEGVGLVRIEVPADGEVPQGPQAGNDAASPAMGDGLHNLPGRA
jgi:hypothetical protein